MVEEQMPKQKIYYSYHPKDERFRKALSAHLSPLKRCKLITTWFTGKIQPGLDRQHEIETNFDAANVFTPLLSADYFDSDEKFAEWQRILERVAANKATVTPIIIRPFHWSRVLSRERNLVLPSNLKAVSSWRNPDEAWDNVARSIDTVVSRTGHSQIPSPAPPLSPTSSRLSFKQDNSSLVPSESGNEPLPRVYPSFPRGPVSPDPSVSRNRESRVVSAIARIEATPKVSPLVQAVASSSDPSVLTSKVVQRDEATPRVSWPAQAVAVYSDLSVTRYEEGSGVSAVVRVEATPKVSPLVQAVGASSDRSLSTPEEDTTERHWVGWIVLFMLTFLVVMSIVLLHIAFHLI